jgi:membrane protease YdiL (CAAX protease family)
LVAFFVLWTVRATYLYAIDDSIASPTARAAYATLLKLVLWGLPAVVFAYRLKSVNPAKYLGLSVFPHLRQWLVCLTVTVIFLFGIVLFELASGRKSICLTGLALLPTIFGLCQFVISPLLEEILFRGLVMRELMDLMSSWLANVINSLLFVGVHLPFWLSHGGPAQAILATAFGIFTFSILACWLFAKSISIWPPGQRQRQGFPQSRHHPGLPESTVLSTNGEIPAPLGFLNIRTVPFWDSLTMQD